MKTSQGAATIPPIQLMYAMTTQRSPKCASSGSEGAPQGSHQLQHQVLHVPGRVKQRRIVGEGVQERDAHGVTFLPQTQAQRQARGQIGPLGHQVRTLVRLAKVDVDRGRKLQVDFPGGLAVIDLAEDLEMFGARLDQAGIKVTEASRSLCDERFVDRMIYCDDPDGNRVELFVSPVKATNPFVPGRPIDGFLTGPYGMGHAVLHVHDVEPVVPFYRDLLEFNVSDYGLYPYGMYFFHVNGRHHSFAMIGTGRRGLHHFMVEYQNLDDVGQGYDLALMQEDMVAYTLGRHTNDYMTSFYAQTPSNFFIESGWGGRVIDVESWQPHETNVGPSFWGHERVHLPEDERGVMREMRLKAASEGRRTPALVDCPWLYDQLTR